MADLNYGDTRLIMRVAERQGLLRNQLAYVLATAFWETARTMEPVRETLARTDQDAAARLERAWSKGQLPWVSKPYWRDGFFGRGYVQLTHERNYIKAGREIGVDLSGNPSLALNADIAAEILVRGSRDGWFTGKRLDDYITLQASNYRGARRVINGTDKATVIAELAREYEAALLAEGYGTEKPAVVVNERRDGTQPRETMLASTTQQATALGALSTVTSLSDQAKAAIGSVTEALGVEPQTALAVVALAAFAWVFRERWTKWLGGVR